MKNVIYKALILSLAALFISACDSGKTSTNEDSADASSIFSVDGEGLFVSGDGSTGRLVIDLVDDRIAVADTSGFFVRVTGASGAGAGGVPVNCGTEDALALLEPQTGTFITDATGSASGRIGCNAAGSFQLICRVGGAGNQSALATVVCTGEGPTGFEGFDGAGGGDLGNGVTDVDNDDDVNNDPFSVRVTNLVLTGVGGAGASIDTRQDNDCDGDASTNDPEPFSDDSVQFTVSNNTQQIVRFSSYNYRVANFDGAGNSYTSPSLNLVGEQVADGQTGSFTGLFADAAGSQKRFFGLSTPITADGFRNVTYILRGTLADGTPVTKEVSSAASFDNFDNC